MTGVNTTIFPDERSWSCAYGEDDDNVYIVDTTTEPHTFVGCLSLDQAQQMVGALGECVAALRARKGLK